MKQTFIVAVPVVNQCSAAFHMTLKVLTLKQHYNVITQVQKRKRKGMLQSIMKSIMKSMVIGVAEIMATFRRDYRTLMMA